MVHLWVATEPYAPYAAKRKAKVTVVLHAATVQTAMRSNHYLAATVQPCQGEAPTFCFLVTF